MKKYGLLFWLAGLGTFAGDACSISDADRCASGYQYESSTKTCFLVPDASATVQNDAAALAPGADTGTTVSSEAGGVTFGTVCAVDGDCTSATTNFCLVQPGASAGYCSKSNCTTECPTGYKCCNCAVMGIVACMTDANATAAAAAYGCTCS